MAAKPFDPTRKTLVEGAPATVRLTSGFRSWQSQ
jgi:hypothetical protein